MRHFISEGSDVPPNPPLVDRRFNPDRRALWRGGRRDSDWINRPTGALTKLQAADNDNRSAAFRRAVFSVLHLWLW